MSKEIFPLKAFELDKIEKYIQTLNYSGLSFVVNSRTLNLSNDTKKTIAYQFDLSVIDIKQGKVGILKITWFRSPILMFKLDEIKIEKRFRFDPTKSKDQQFNFGSRVLEIFERRLVKRFGCVGILYDAVKDMNDWFPGNRVEKANPAELYNFYENRGWHKLFPAKDKSKIRFFSSKNLKTTEILELQKFSENGVF
jgi:hypothetical protein